jgi:adenylate kinase
LDDANEEVIRKRLATYEEETKPVLEHYGDLVTTIDALQPPVKVLKDILGVIWNLARRTGSNGVQPAVTLQNR